MTDLEAIGRSCFALHARMTARLLSRTYEAALRPLGLTLPQFGIQVRFADYRDPDSFAALIDERTKAIFCESIGNPLGNVVDFGALAQIAHSRGVPLMTVPLAAPRRSSKM